MKALHLGITALFLIIVVTLFSLILAKVKEAKKEQKASTLYLIVTAFCIGIVALPGFPLIREDIYSYFILFQILVFCIGVLHAFLLYKLVPWSVKTRFTWEFLFTLAILFLGSVFFLLAYNFILRVHVLQFKVLSAGIWFLVPFLFLQAMNRYRMIPERVFRKWFYPVGKEINDPLDSELVSLLVISFVFHKNLNDPEITTFRAKAPANMEFWRLFYYFVNDYNDRHREGPIEFLDSEAHPYGWVFHHKPNWFWWKRYLDPDLIIKDNKIRENSVIICHRSKES